MTVKWSDGQGQVLAGNTEGGLAVHGFVFLHIRSVCHDPRISSTHSPYIRVLPALSLVLRIGTSSCMLDHVEASPYMPSLLRRSAHLDYAGVVRDPILVALSLFC